MFLTVLAGTLFSWLESSSVALFFRQSLWLYPAVEIVHISSFSFLVGAAVLFDLRLMGLSKKFPIIDCLRYLKFWARISFSLIVPSGFILFMVDATSLASNTAFLLKLILIFLALLNAWIFQRYTMRSVHLWNTGITPPLKARFAGTFSILMWISVISCGRLIAYI